MAKPQDNLQCDNLSCWNRQNYTEISHPNTICYCCLHFTASLKINIMVGYMRYLIKAQQIQYKLWFASEEWDSIALKEKCIIVYSAAIFMKIMSTVKNKIIQWTLIFQIIQIKRAFLLMLLFCCSLDQIEKKNPALSSMTEWWLI